MPPKLKKPTSKPKIQPKVVKRLSTKVSTQVGIVKLQECFTRDISFESFLPPSLYPREKRDMDFHLAATVRPVGPNISCVNVAMRIRISPQGNPPVIIFEMIQEGVFNTTCENIHEAKKLYVQGGPQVYEKARTYALNIFAMHGVKPPIPAEVNFTKMWQDNNNSK